MSDNLRRYRAIRDAWTQWYPGAPKGHLARHLTTLAAVISGIVASQNPQLPKIASQVPDGEIDGEESLQELLTTYADPERAEIV